MTRTFGTSVCVIVIAGCGRIGYDPVQSTAPPDAAIVVMVDAAPPAFDAGAPVEEEDAGDLEPDGGACTTVMLRASRCDTPTSVSVGSRAFSPARVLELPRWLDVSEGNAGDRWARIALQRRDGSWISCCYQGGAPSPDPTSEAEIALGRRYFFDHCVRGESASCPSSRTVIELDAESAVEAQSVELRVQSSAPSFGNTEIEWRVPCP